jgi:hypothetical protein
MMGNVIKSAGKNTSTTTMTGTETSHIQSSGPSIGCSTLFWTSRFGGCVGWTILSSLLLVVVAMAIG